jgi:hypothetical protein
LLERLLIFFSLDDNSRAIKKFYKANFSFSQKSSKKVLIEAFQVPSNEISIIHFLAALKISKDITPIGYYLFSGSYFSRIKLKLRFQFSPLKIAGVKKLIILNATLESRKQLEKFSNDLIKGVNSNSELEDLMVDGVVLGDLIYDYYLNTENAHTIEIHKKNLISYISEFIFYLRKFESILEKYDIEAILVSHCVYRWGIPVRVGIAKNIKVFQITGESAYLVSKSNPFAYTDFESYPRNFLRLPTNVQEEGIKEASLRLERRFRGEVGVDMPYSSESAFKSKLQDQKIERIVIAKSNRIKILIAIHDFYDSPHPFGKNLYPDIYLWLEALKVLASKVNYDWYIKTHPDIAGNGEAILKEFCLKNKEFTILSPKTSHHEIINQGINFALTVYGTIAMEYPLLGVPVINASTKNPHVAYNFSLSPRDVSEYEELILNLENLSCNIPKNEIFEYYYMHHIHKVDSLLFKNYDLYLKDMGGYKTSTTILVYKYYIDSSNRLESSATIRAFSNFISSGEERLQLEHFHGKEDYSK